MIYQMKILGDNRIPDFLKFKKYFELLRQGFEYAQKTFGDESLPTGIIISYETIIIKGKKEWDWIGYLPETDQFAVSFPHIAIQCFYYNNPQALFYNSKIPSNKRVLGEDQTILQAIEECYHRYQIKVLLFEPQNTERNQDHPLEKNATPIIQKAVNDLRIRLY